MDERYAEVYGGVARQHWWWRARDAAVATTLARLTLPPPPRRVLDVGCGDGRLFPLLARYGAVEGIEPDGTAMGKAPAPGIHVAPFARPLPVQGPYALVTMLDVLEHLDAPVEALQLVAEVLAPGGLLLLTVPAYQWLWTGHDDLNRHRARYTPDALRDQLGQAGLQVTTLRHLFHGLVVPKLGVRFLERLGRTGTELPRVPPAAINWIAERWFRAESRLARPVAGWLPGSSLLAVARRR
jgi:SAM-dependent methyltransferase